MTKKAADNVLEQPGDGGQVDAESGPEICSDSQAGAASERVLETDESDDKLAELLSRIERLAGVGVSDEVPGEDVRPVATT